MTPLPTAAPSTATSKRYRLPGIEREGIAQLSLLETALWPLQGGKLPDNQFETAYSFVTHAGRKTAQVTVRAALGLRPIDEYILWGLLGATLNWKQPDPVLMATPYWMLRNLGLETGGSQYAELRQSLLRLAVASYQNTGFYNPLTQEHDYAAFQFLSILLPTVDGVGETVDNERCWRIEWNPTFFRFCRATGGNLLFDMDLYRRLSPAARRLFLKLQDRFWRADRVFFNVDDLTTNGLGFAAERPLKKRKFDLTTCLAELIDHHVLTLGRGQIHPKDLFVKRAKGSYVVVCYPRDYFRQPLARRITREQNALSDDPLYEPLQKIGVDAAAIRRLFKDHSRALIQRWVRITDAAMNERPRGFPGFRTSPAAFCIDGIQHQRTPPDWLHAHEKRLRQRQWEQEHAASSEEEQALLNQYAQERSAALRTYLSSADGRHTYQQAYRPLLDLYTRTEPHRVHDAAHEAAIAHIERHAFRFPDYAAWLCSRKTGGGDRPA